MPGARTPTEAIKSACKPIIGDIAVQSLADALTLRPLSKSQRSASCAAARVHGSATSAWP